MARVTRTKRAYSSDVREAQTALTRQRLLDAALALAGEGAALSMREVAARAGVAALTAYRHFETTQALEDAIVDEVNRRLNQGVDEAGMERLDEAMLVHWFENYERLGSPMRALRQTERGKRERRARAPRRRAMVEKAFAKPLALLPADERDAFIDVMSVLVSTGAIELFQDYLVLDGKTIAQRVSWVARALTAYAEDRAPAAKRKKR